MPYLILAMLAFISCAVVRPLDDRLTFSAQAILEQQSAGSKVVQVQLDEVSQNYVHHNQPDGSLGYFGDYQWPIGRTLNAYLLQASRLQRGQEGVIIKVKIVDVDLHFTNSAYSLYGNLFADWAKLSITLETTYPNGQLRRSILTKEVDLPSEVTITVRDDRAVQMALEGIVVDYLREIRTNLNGISP